MEVVSTGEATRQNKKKLSYAGPERKNRSRSTPAAALTRGGSQSLMGPQAAPGGAYEAPDKDAAATDARGLKLPLTSG